MEIKIERRFTNNLFLETWSNRNLEDELRHAEFGSNGGWLQKSRADILAYYFLDSDDLIMCGMFRLKQWAYKERKIEQFKEVAQSKYIQLNDTWGRLVPISILERDISCRRLKVKQLTLPIDDRAMRARRVMAQWMQPNDPRLRAFDAEFGL